MFGWLLWQLHLACQKKKSMVLIVKTSCIIYESSLFILSQVYIHREYDFLDYESGEVSSTKCSEMHFMYSLVLIGSFVCPEEDDL